MGLKEKLPLINSDSKRTRIIGYVVYAWIGLAILGAIVPAPDTTGSGAKASTATNTMLTQAEKDNITSSILDWESDGTYGRYQVAFKPNSNDMVINITPTKENIARENARYDRKEDLKKCLSDDNYDILSRNNEYCDELKLTAGQYEQDHANDPFVRYYLLVEEAVCINYLVAVADFPNIGDLTVNIESYSYKCQRSWITSDIINADSQNVPELNKELMEKVQATAVYT